MSRPQLDAIHGGVIVSVQAEQGEPFYPLECLGAMADSALSGGACALRLAGAEPIGYMKSRHPGVPVVGITKPAVIPANYHELVYITPTLADVAAIAESGSEIVALDATNRPRPKGEALTEIVAGARARFPEILLMADIATLEDGLNAQALGFDLISTTLAGYTVETANRAENGPDFGLLEALAHRVSVPLILEGRIWEPAEVRRAFKLGAHAVVIGSAITRPHLITRRFCEAAPRSVSRPLAT